jgi:hypothetical protein
MQVESGRKQRSEWTWSPVLPYTSERAPHELLPIIPPRAHCRIVAGIRPELQPVRSAGAVQAVQPQSRLHPRPPTIDIDLEHAVHVLREVDDDRGSDRLAGERGASAARKDGDALLGRDAQDGLDVLDAARQHDPHGEDLVQGSVGTVEEA